MRFILMLAAATIATAALAQTPARNRTLEPIPTVLPAQTPKEKPAFLEDSVILDKNPRGTIHRRTGDPFDELPLPAEQIEKLRQAELQKQPSKQQYYKKIAEPMLSPDGQELVGIVENRYLTKDQLKKRVDLLMKALPSPDKALKEKTGIIIESQDNAVNKQQREEDRRILIEGRVLDDWAQITTLAVHAGHAAQNEDPKLRVTEAEIDQAIKKLASDAQVDASKIPVAMQSVMFSERELRQEVHDSLIIEKFMHEYVRRTYNDEQLRELYKKTPQAFIEPTKVHAWDLFVPKEARSEKDKSAASLKNKLDDWRGSLNRCKNVEDFKALGEKIQKETPFILSDMGWILNTDLIDMEVKTAVFGMAPGKTSKVVESPEGFHIIKVIERQDGEKNTFENAKPHIVDYLAVKSRDFWYDQLKGRYGVKMAAGGLKKWTTVGPANETPPQAQAAPDAANTSTSLIGRTPVNASNEPSLDALRRSGYLQPGRAPSAIQQPASGSMAPKPARRSGRIAPGLTPPPMLGTAKN